MQIVFTSGIRNLPSRPLPLPQLYRDHLEEAVLAEELGFDNVWASEHHFSPDLGGLHGAAKHPLDGAARLSHGGGRGPRPCPIRRAIARVRPRPGDPSGRLRPDPPPPRGNPGTGLGRSGSGPASSPALLPHPF